MFGIRGEKGEPYHVWAAALAVSILLAGIGIAASNSTVSQVSVQQTVYGPYSVGQQTNIPGISIGNVTATVVNKYTYVDPVARLNESGTLYGPYSVGQSTNIPGVSIYNITVEVINKKSGVIHQKVWLNESAVRPTVANATSNYTVSLSPGWNLFSFPIIASGYSPDYSLSSCSSGEISSPVWSLSNGTYLRTGELADGSGYWVRSSVSCTLAFSGTGIKISEFQPLEKGWNIMGSLPVAVPFNSIAGTCNLTAGPYGYAPNTGSYYLANTLEPGNGYLVEVSSACSLGSHA
jgi:hypothetical protein